MEDAPANITPPAATAIPAPQQLRFTGTGASYFGIWIVNLLLTIVTLGIYSAWAKVRRLQYFYRHTELAQTGFDFHGSPKRILLGRIIAFIMLVVYNMSVRLHSIWTLVIIIALAAILPWLLRNSLRFRLYNTSWRGTRFHFRGTVGGAYRVFLLNGFLSLITLYGMLPFAHQRLKAYQHDNSWFGQTRFSFHARPGQFYLLYLMLLAGFLAFGILFGMAGIFSMLKPLLLAQQQHGGPVDPKPFLKAFAIIYGALILMSVIIGPIFHALMTNLVWSNTRLGEHRIDCHMSPLKLTWITVTNLVLVVVTFGLFIPWAMVRMTRLHVESITFIPATDLQEFAAAPGEDLGAVGAETANVFDFDIAL
jgi:uncharacterized membrane protein YjgN (DUF898 family)